MLRKLVIRYTFFKNITTEICRKQVWSKISVKSNYFKEKYSLYNMEVKRLLYDNS